MTTTAERYRSYRANPRFRVFGERLRTAMKSHEMSVVALATKLSVAAGTVYQWRQGIILPHINHRIGMATALKIDYDALFMDVPISRSSAGIGRETSRRPFPIRLHAALHQRKMAPHDLGRLLEEAGASAGLVSGWLLGERMPNMHNRVLLCRVLEISYDELFAGLPFNTVEPVPQVRYCQRCGEPIPLKNQWYGGHSSWRFYANRKTCSDECRSARLSVVAGVYNTKNYPPLAEARQILADAGIKTREQYHAWKQRPKNLPYNIAKVYGSFSVLTQGSPIPDRNYIILAFRNARMTFKNIASILHLPMTTVTGAYYTMQRVERDDFRTLHRKPGRRYHAIKRIPSH